MLYGILWPWLYQLQACQKQLHHVRKQSRIEAKRNLFFLRIFLIILKLFCFDDASKYYCNSLLGFVYTVVWLQPSRLTLAGGQAPLGVGDRITLGLWAHTYRRGGVTWRGWSHHARILSTHLRPGVTWRGWSHHARILSTHLRPGVTWRGWSHHARTLGTHLRPGVTWHGWSHHARTLSTHLRPGVTWHGWSHHARTLGTHLCQGHTR